MANLCMLGEDGTVVQRWEVGEQPITIGRDQTASVSIQDEVLSRLHFTIWRENNRYLIKDLNSQNGTWVDGQRAQGNTLKHNDCILAGRTLFLFHAHTLPAAGSPDGLLPDQDTAFLPAILAADRAARRAAANVSVEQTG